MREFRTAAKAAVTEDDKVKFIYDGRECTALKPSEGKIGLLIAGESDPLADDNQRIAASINFALTMFDNDTRRYFGQRLINPEHPDNIEFGVFEFEDLMDVVHGVIEDFTGRPTKRSSDSTPSLGTGGPTSTDGASPEVSDSSSKKLLTPAT